VSTPSGAQVQEWLSLPNGCLCCTVKDAGVAALEDLIANSTAPFDYILLETTGLANPANIAPMFWLDGPLNAGVYLDGVVTVVDGKNLGKSLEGEEGELGRVQIACADVVVVTKGDLVGQAGLKTVGDVVRSINGVAKLVEAKHGAVEQLEGVILDLKAYDEVAALELWKQEEGKGVVDGDGDDTVGRAAVGKPVGWAGCLVEDGIVGGSPASGAGIFAIATD
jgi:G3E family GTPase